MMDDTFNPKFHISPRLQEQLRQTGNEVLAEMRARGEAEWEEVRGQERRKEAKQLVWLFLAIMVLAWLAAMIWSHIFDIVREDIQRDTDAAANQWLDTSDARQCFDYRGMKEGRMVMGCKDGRNYEVPPRVVERAQQLREQEEGR